MKTIEKILYFLLGIPYLVFGVNFFINFLPMPPLGGNAAIFLGILGSTGFLATVKILEIAFALALFFNIRRHLILVLLAPITVNVFMFEVFIAGQPAIGMVLLIIHVFLLFRNQGKYQQLLSK